MLCRLVFQNRCLLKLLMRKVNLKRLLVSARNVEIEDNWPVLLFAEMLMAVSFLTRWIA